MINIMRSLQEKILVVENDPSICDLIARQTLVPMGFQVKVSADAATALEEMDRFSPDLILVDLNLPGLSGKDFLIALLSQGMDVPLIVIAEQGRENDIIDSFRLGAADFLTQPIREAEIVSVVERVLKQVRSRREKDRLARQLNQLNKELQGRVKELTTLFAVGKAVTSITDLPTLFNKIVEGAVFVSDADSGWLLLKEERNRKFLLSAGRNLPASINSLMNQEWDDGLSFLVAKSGESLSISGDPLKRFQVTELGEAVLVTPIKIATEVVGLLTVVRKANQQFSKGNQALLEAVADYASIAIVNARLFRVLTEKIDTSQKTMKAARFGERASREILSKIGEFLQESYTNLQIEINRYLYDPGNKPVKERMAEIASVSSALDHTTKIVNFLSQTSSQRPAKDKKQSDINALTREVCQLFQPIAEQLDKNLIVGLSNSPILIPADGFYIIHGIVGLISYAIRESETGAYIIVRVEKTAENLSQLTIQVRNWIIPNSKLKSLFSDSGSGDRQAYTKSVGLGLPLAIIQEIFETYNGKVWVESNPEIGVKFFVLLPSASS